MEVRGHIELRTAFTDGAASRTANIRYFVRSFSLQHSFGQTCFEQDYSSGLVKTYEDEVAFP